MSTTDYPNQEALNKALNIYRTYMRAFIIFHLKKVQGQQVEDIVIGSLDDAGQSDRADEIDRLLRQSNRDIKSIIDVDDFPRLINTNWKASFTVPLNDDKTFRNQLWLIKDSRDQSWAHPPEGDAESEGTRAYLFLIADVLRKINRPDKQSEVEAIRDELFYDDSAERLEKAEKRLKDLESEKSETAKRLADAQSKKKEYEEKNTALSKQVDEKESQRKKLDRQLKRAKTQNDKYKKDIAGTKQRLEESEASQADYKNRLETTSKDLEEAKKEWQACEDSLRSTSDQLEEAVGVWMTSMENLAAIRNLFTVTAIGEQEVQEVFQSVYPPIQTDSTVRILDRRGVDKKNYLLELLEHKQPTIIYVQSEDKIEQLSKLVGSEKAEVIREHSEQTSESEEIEILKRLENRELVAVVSNTAFSTLTSAHCVEHFVFCHLVPSLDEFFNQCEQAFTAEKNAYLHLIYNKEQDVEGLNQWLTQKYPDAEALGELYRELRGLAETSEEFIKPENVYNENIYNKLGMAKLGVQTGLAIFQELQFLERNERGVKVLPDPEKRGLDESKIHCGGEALKHGIADAQAFQLKQPIEQIWEEILEKLSVDSEQILREQDTHDYGTRDDMNTLRTFQETPENSKAQPEQSPETVEGDDTVDNEDAEAKSTPKPARANAKVTVEQVREIRARSAAGESNSELAKEFNLSSTAIGNIVRRKTWTDVE